MIESCPNCKKEIKSQTALFCYFCGTFLEKQQEVSEEKKEVAKVNKKRPKAKQLVIVFSLVAVFSLTAISLLNEPRDLIINKIISKSEKTSEILNTEIPNSIPAQKEGSIVLNVTLFKNEINFGLEKFESLTPISADYYFETPGIDTLEEKLGNELADFKSVVLETSDKTLSDYFKDAFAVFELENKVGILLKPLGDNLPFEDSDSIEGGYKYANIENYVLLYKDGSVFTAVSEASQKLSKNLGMDSKFLSTLKFVPAKGFAFGFINNSEAFLKSREKGWAFFLNSLSDDNILKISDYFYAIAKNGEVRLLFKTN